MAGAFIQGQGTAGQILFIGAYLALAALAAGGVLRVCVSIYVWTRSRSPLGLAILTTVVALLGPLGGLLLNQWIRFPSDFQMPAVYALAILNGLLLVLPNFSHPLLHRAVWLAQCAMFAFTAYFFAVFLPLLPLAPLSLLFLGFGSLMYVPSLLFLLHGYRLLDGFRAEVRDGGKWLPALLGISALLAWPAGYTLQARGDRAALHQALDYLQYPDYSRNARFSGSLGALHSSLIHIRDFKQGFYLPYLSEYYNWLAFDNLTLSQNKLDALAKTFFGQPLPKLEAKQDFALFLRGNGRARNVSEALGGIQGERPSANAVIENITTATKLDRGMARTTAAITIHNPAAGATEFQSAISMPPGVMISGMWLTIGTERVPGRIFEERSALWVYQKITEVRPVARDPAILRYTGPAVAELRVYPVESGAPRQVEVEFLYPDGLDPDIRIGARELAIAPSETPSAPSLGVSGDGSFSVTLPEKAAAAFPKVSRKPYLHFLVDVSANSKFRDPELLKEAIRQAAGAFPSAPSAREARLSFVNFETRDFGMDGRLPISELLNLPANDFRPPRDFFRGGFLGFRAVKETLWRHHRALSASDGQALKSFPRIVILHGSSDPMPPDETGNLAEFARLLPDSAGFWSFKNGNLPMEFTPFDPRHQGEDDRPVRIFQVGGERFAASLDGPVSYTSIRAAISSLEKIEAFDAASGRFVPAGPPLVQPASPDYNRAIGPWSLEFGRIFEPFAHRGDALGTLLKLCRETGILVPSVAYMVVENTAQWRILERTEKKALKGHEALALSEPAVTPEP
ncbi:MAG TPA: MSEP-CTERM sorting domain-containing protein, partial [Chthoniobacterales bacterium]